jgi:hypothetical protein
MNDKKWCAIKSQNFAKAIAINQTNAKFALLLWSKESGGSA